MCCGGHNPSIVSRVAHGVAGVAKALVGIDITPLDEQLRRARICKGGPGIPPCESSGIGLFCGECGCIIAAKIRNASEHCPKGKW